MNSVTKTVYMADLQLKALRSGVYKPLPNTTLNEKFSIKANVDPEIPTMPKLAYFSIGNGNTSAIHTEQRSALSHGNHLVTDGALYNTIPFIVRKLTEDLSVNAKLKYRMRKIVKIAGVEYALYYLKAIDQSVVNNQYLKIYSKDNESPKISIFNTNDSTILNPVPREETESVTSIGNNYIALSDQISLTLTIEELGEIQDAMTLLYPDETVHLINELALCSGIDIVDDQIGNLESIYTQVMFFVDMDYDLQVLINRDEGLYREMEVGSMEPLSLD